jgi:competence protein ComEC
MKLPAAWLAAALAAGIAAEWAWPARPGLWLAISIAALLSGLACLLVRRVALAGCFALAAWCALGALALAIEKDSVAQDNVAHQISAGQLDVSAPLHWRGRLRNDPLRLPWGIRYELDLERAEDAQGPRPASGGLRLNYYEDERKGETAPDWRAGDRIEVLAIAHEPRNFLNPGAFDERGYLARQGIYLIGTLRSFDLADTLAPPPLTLRYRLARLRGRLLREIDAIYPAEPQHAAVLRAMLLGDRSFVDSDLATAFQQTGAYHVLVVAGLHVGILAGFLLWLGGLLRLPRRSRALIALAGLVAYASIVQDRPPILRAVLMAGAYIFARMLGRRGELLNAVALAAAALLLWKPSYLQDSGFQLSFLAAGVIAGLAIPWIARSSLPWMRGLRHVTDVTRDRGFPPRVAQFRLDLRSLTHWLADRLPVRRAGYAGVIITTPFRALFYLWELFVLSAVLQIGLLPMQAAEFHRVSLAGPVSNILAVLLAGLIVPLGFVALALHFVWAAAGGWIAGFVNLLAGWLLDSVQWFSHWPRLSYRIPGPPVILLALFLITIALLCFSVRQSEAWATRRARLAEYFIACVLLILCVLVAGHPFPPRLDRGKLEVTVLDAGQGDSIFVALPDGRTMLVDGGGMYGINRAGGYRPGIDIGESVISPYLWSRGLKRIDTVVLTHAHEDHLAGLLAVLANFHVGELWLGHEEDTPEYWQLLREARAHGIPIVHKQRADEFHAGPVTGKLLWPADDSALPKASNDDSVVLRLEDGDTAFLLPGDIERPVEAQLLAAGDMLRADFLKVPHHGSKTSSTADFLDAVKPKFAVISAGAGNIFNLPHPDVVARYHSRGITLYETTVSGAVSGVTDGHQLSVTPFAVPASTSAP